MNVTAGIAYCTHLTMVPANPLSPAAAEVGRKIPAAGTPASGLTVRAVSRLSHTRIPDLRPLQPRYLNLTLKVTRHRVLAVSPSRRMHPAKRLTVEAAIRL